MFHQYQYQAEIHTDTRLMTHTDTDITQTFIRIAKEILVLVLVGYWVLLED